MSIIVCGARALQETAARLNFPLSGMETVIAQVSGEEFQAGVIYDKYNQSTIWMHIAIDHRVNPYWTIAVFDYPFNVLGVTKVIAPIAEENLRCRKLAEHLGFKEEARIEDYYTFGALCLYTMQKHECRVLNAASWEKARSEFREANRLQQSLPAADR